MDLTSGFLTSSFGTVIVSTPFSIEAFTSFNFAFSGNLNLLVNFPLLLSTLCHVSFLSSFSTFLSPLICRILSSSTSTFTSSFLIPGRSALNTCASGVSFQSTRVFTKAEVSLEASNEEVGLKGKSLKGSQISILNGSKMLLRLPPKKLGMIDIFSSDQIELAFKKMIEMVGKNGEGDVGKNTQGGKIRGMKRGRKKESSFQFMHLSTRILPNQIPNTALAAARHAKPAASNHYAWPKQLCQGFFASSFGTVIVSTPFSIEAFTSFNFAFSGNLNLLVNFPLLRSTLCHVSFLSSFSTFLSPLICRILSSSTSTFTSSFFIPGRSALNTWASGVSFQSTRVFTKAEVSLEASNEEVGKGKSLKGSQTSKLKGSKMLLRRPPKKLGMIDIFSSD
ncbi:hypothetical protein OSB04_020855 [Centaurea solstitialis]|uniref:Uncharacterized protein n=1 Tax=Centaurea solstitialis TaxID=347529 RepID=A0AA38W696_9ASTR|nr:hypothetical protein OSB04_020855 [Centaurea solstitialis]